MVHDPEPGADYPEDWDDEDADLLNESDFDPFDDLDEAEADLIAEMREAADREWLIPDSWYDDGGNDTRDQPDG